MMTNDALRIFGWNLSCPYRVFLLSRGVYCQSISTFPSRVKFFSAEFGSRRLTKQFRCCSTSEKLPYFFTTALYCRRRGSSGTFHHHLSHKINDWTFFFVLEERNNHPPPFFLHYHNNIHNHNHEESGIRNRHSRLGNLGDCTKTEQRWRARTCHSGKVRLPWRGAVPLLLLSFATLDSFLLLLLLYLFSLQSDFSFWNPKPSRILAMPRNTAIISWVCLVPSFNCWVRTWKSWSKYATIWDADIPKWAWTRPFSPKWDWH